MNHVEKRKLKSNFVQCSNCGSYLSAIHYCIATNRLVLRDSVVKKTQALRRIKYKKVWKSYADRWKNGEIVSALDLVRVT